VIDVEVNVVISQSVAEIVQVDVVQVTSKSHPAVTFQVTSNVLDNVVAQVTPNVPQTVALLTIVTSSKLTSSAVNEVVVISLEVKFVIVPFVAFKSVVVTSVAFTVVQVNVQSAVIFPVKVTSPFTVCRVTLDKSNPS
jgi:hypothetical protein